MSFVPGRLRAGELLAGCAGAFCIVVLLAVTWYRAPAVNLTGWQCYGALRWALLLCGVLALCIPLAQASFRAPAIPVTLATVDFALSTVTLVWLFVRVVFASPDGFSATAGPWLALLAQLAIIGSCILSLRQEGIRDADGPGEIPVVSPE